MSTNDLRRTPKAPVNAWTERLIVGDQLGLDSPPDWLVASYEIFREHVSHPAYPCFFGTRAERRGEMFYAFASEDDLSQVARSIEHFCELSARKEFNRANLALFFRPKECPLDLAGARAFCWRLLQHVHDTDVAKYGQHASAECARVALDDSAWEYTAFNTEMFVVGCSPSYQKRKSRNLGPGIVMLFQPRRVFVDLVTKKAISGEARDEVRRRLLAWDAMQHHPDLGVYGDPRNREWKQYFLDDDNEPEGDFCPFVQRWEEAPFAPNLIPSSSLVALLEARAARTPDKTAITFLKRKGGGTETFSYARLAREARRLAVLLRKRATPGERAILLLPTGPEYVVSFYACLYARIIAVPAFPVPSARHSAERARIVGMVQDSEPALMLTDAAGEAGLSQLTPEIAPAQIAGTICVVRIDASAEPSEDAWGDALPDAQDIAFLQYTSGSTAAPKGVIVTHGNALANEHAISHAFAFRSDDVLVSWLPLYHDMGLIGCLLAPLYNDIPVVLMTPNAFLEAPARWLRTMSEYRATMTGGPDSAFRLALSRVRDEDLAGIDLSQWRLAFCGAEPIRADTMRAFAERFAAQGFQAQALLPCYGLAEATLLVTAAPAGDGARELRVSREALSAGVIAVDASAASGADDLGIVDSGIPSSGVVVRISDPETGCELPEGQVGEIWVSGASISPGYFRADEASARTFRTLTLEDGQSTRALRTGDLGFMHDGRLFVSGRLKDMIVLRGQNVYPQDIEQLLEARVAGLRAGRVAAFAVSGERGESIAVAFEVASSQLARLREDPGAARTLVDSVQATLASAWNEAAALVMLLKPGTLPRTSSGKLRRSACLSQWRDGQLSPLFVSDRSEESARGVVLTPEASLPHVAPRTMTEHVLASVWNEVLGPRSRGVHADFFAEGGESITAARLHARIGALFGAALPLEQLFQARTIAKQAALIEARDDAPAARAAPGIPRLAEDTRPLSAAQYGLWLFHELDPTSPAYTVTATLTLRGELDVKVLRAALSAVLARHELLRARFAYDASGAVGWTTRPQSEACAWQELSAGEPDAEHALEALLQAPFALDADPLLRACLVARGPLEHALHFTLPHLIADGASAAIVLRELGQAYTLLRAGMSARAGFAPLELHYGDYAAWQRAASAEPGGARSEQEAIAHYRALLGAELEPLSAPGKRALPLSTGGHTHAAGHVEIVLPEAVVGAARALGRRCDATLSMTLLAAFDVLLYRYTGERSVTIGVPANTRSRVELEGVVGHFVNLLLHHVTISPSQSFAEVVASVRRAMMAVAAHREVPFERVVAALRSPGSESASHELSSPRITFNHQHWQAELEFAGLTVAGCEVGNLGAPFDWTLSVRESSNETRLRLEYRAQWFERAFIEQVVADYVAILTQVTSDPDGKIARLALRQERETSEQHAFDPVSERFARCAAERGEAVAVVCDASALSYDELARWAHNLAARLSLYGVGPEDRVGLCLGRSLAIAPSILGVLASGGAFVPLDASYPAARLAAMIEDAGITIAVVDEEGRRALREVGATLRWLDVSDPALRAVPAAAPVRRLLPDQLAYVLFTSGSTGRAKGVEISQRALSLHVDDYLRAFDVSATDTVLQFSTVNFDAALEQLLPVLTVGGRVVMRGVAVWPLEELHDVLGRERVSLAYLPTGYWQAWTWQLNQGVPLPPELRRVTVGGEALPGEAVARWRESGWGEISLANTYGPTEATITTSAHLVSEQDCREAIVPIGKSLPGRRAYVLDADGAEVPLGSIGELCIGGVSVARGYLGRPSATAERFVPDPFAGAGSGDGMNRLYRTGDRCRRRADGTLEYLGRFDDQVKVRGYRIELGDLESALRACAGVKDAVAVVRGSGEQKQLVAYVTGASDGEALRAALTRRLPFYLVPSVIVPLSDLPRLPNGKLNRRALPEPAAHLERPVSARTLPEDARERVLLTIFQRVLRREDVGTDDDFFALGGDSISSLQVVAFARAEQLAITARMLFEQPTVRLLARQVEALPELQANAREVTPAEPGADYTQILAEHGLCADQVERVLPATAVQAGLLFHAGFSADVQADAQRAYVDQICLTVRGDLDHSALSRAWQAAAERHDILRTAFVATRDGALQVVRREVVVPVAFHDGSGEQAEAYALLIESLRQREASPGFDVTRAPLMRVLIVTRPDGAYDLVWTNHHAILDGWSAGQLIGELFADHAAIVRGREPDARPAPSYENYVRWLAAQPSNEDYWRAEFAAWDAPATLASAFGRPREPQPGAHHLRYRLDPVLRAQLSAAAARARVTLPTLAQAAWGLVLGRHGDRQQALFGATFSNRPPELPDAERMIGLFIHSLPVCLRLEPEREVDAFLQDVQQRTAQGRAHGTTPLADLQRWAGSSGRSLFDSVLVFENYPLPEAELTAEDGEGLRVVDVRTIDRTHYPLTLTLYPRRDPAASIDVEWEWDGEQVDAAWVEALSAEYLTTLAELAAPGRRRLAELAGRADLTAQPLAHHAYRALASRVTERAALSPDDVALSCEGVETSYAALDAWSTRIAHALRRAGVVAEALVGVSVSRSAALPASLLAVWKAGGAYVPLDPSYPAARTAEMLRGVAVVVCDAETAEKHAQLFAPLRVIRVEDVAAESETGVFNEPHREQLAYVIYTSGSTGRPKGVAVTHGALSAHVDDFLATYGLRARDRVLFSSTINFDVSLHELFPALTVGGRVVMRGDEPWSLEMLTSVLREQEVTFARVATAYWQAWTKRLAAGDAFPALRQVTVGGEALSGDALARWQAGPLSGVPLDNLYGPTETTVAALRKRTGEGDVRATIVAIGQRFASRSARVRGLAGQVAPHDALGELCIGGVTLARGYLGQPGLTAERFVPDPERAGGRLYRSGDLCRERADGEVEFLGRADAQVKLRGFRIELGEIEAALRAHDGVESCVVEVKGEGEHRRLVAYVTGSVDLSLLEAALRARLPAWMVPASYLALPALPLLPNGKVDRRGLPEPEREARALVAPRSERERVLWEIWRAVLKRPELGVTENFFELGGDSILSLQILARARDAGLQLMPKQVFEQPTIEACARLAQPVSTQKALQSVVGEVPLTPIQERFFARFPHGPAHWNQSVLLRVQALSLEALERALVTLVERHDALRMRFTRDPQGSWQARVVESAPSALHTPVETTDLRGEADVQAALDRAGARFQASLDLAQGPLLRAAHFLLPAGEERLLLVVHHLAVDGVSWRILLSELERAYSAAEAGREIRLPPASTPFGAWAMALRDYAERADLSQDAAFYRALLAGAPGVLAERAAVAGDRSYGASRELTWRLSRADTERLLRMAPRAYRMRVDEVLLTALAEVLGELVPARELLVDLEGHGREELIEGSELSRSVGWFTTRFPVRLRPGQGARAALIAVKEQLRALPSKGLSWGLLRSKSEREALEHLPAPAVSFNYLGVFALSESSTEQRFALAQESAGSPVDLRTELAHALDINAIVKEGELSAGFRFSPEIVNSADVERLIERFDGAVRALIEHGLTAAPSATAADFPLARVRQEELEASGLDLAEVADLYPATALQAGLLFHTAGDEADGAYVYQLRLGLSGALDVAAFRAAWQEVVARHDTLRTSFVWLDGAGHARTPLSVVQRMIELPFASHDWSRLTDGAYEARLAQWCAEDRARGFDVACAPLLRLHVFRRDEARVDFVWTMHHALSDGWSSARILDEVLRAYRQRRRGEESAALSPRDRPRYRDYVRWLGAQPSGEAYFRARLARLSEPALVATSVVRRAPAASGERTFARDDAWTARLKSAARRNRVTVATLVQAAWALVLARRADRAQAAFAVTVSGRPSALPGVEQIVGPFLNTLPLFIDVPGVEAGSAARFLADVHREALSLRQHEHVPLSDVQRWAQGSGPLFDSLLVVENYPLDRAGLDRVAGEAGLSIGDVSVVSRTHYPLSLTLSIEPSLELSCEWDGAQLAEQPAVQLAEQLLATLELLASISPDDTRSLCALCAPASSPSQREPERRPFRSVLARIDAWANVRPDAVAVSCAGHVLSYAALDLWSTQLFTRLAQYAEGRGTEERIGLALPRSVELVVALLGIWKTGAGYVPLDPAYPRARLRAIADAAGVRRIVTDAETKRALAEVFAGRELVLLEPLRGGDVLLDVLPGDDAETLWDEPHPEALAYVLSTSGSSGKPKGVALSQRALALHVDDYIESYALSADDRVYQFSTFNFDAAAEQLFPALSVGATVVMRGPELPSWQDFHAELARERISVMDLPTAFFQAWLVEQPSALPALRLLTAGGETLAPDVLAAFRASALGHVRLDNSYGPTEAAIAALAHETVAEDVLATSVPLGRPYPARSAHVLDRFGDQVSDEALGELCIGGAALARGYDGHPALTAERFVPDPFSAVPGARLYRTGDCAHRAQDGTIMFEGRRDGQRKIRGHRVELGEIEAALRACVGVEQAVAVSQTRATGTQLVAYVTGEVDVAELERELAQRLPAYALPQAIVVLPAIPLKHNGKVDRAALPAPVLVEAVPSAAAANELETKLLAIFSTVLERADVGLHDDFLALGGDSISSLRVVARAHALGLALTPRQVLEQATVARLARVARPALERARVVSHAPLTLTPIQAEFFATHPHGESHYNQAVLLRVDAELDLDVLEAALNFVLRRHDALRLRFERAADGHFRQRVARIEPTLHLVSRDLRASSAWQEELDAACDALQTSLDIQHGPLLSAGHFALPSDSAGRAEARLFLAVHHLAIDGVSWRILLAELNRAYDALLAGAAPELPEPALSWSAWVEALQDYARSETVQQELTAWLALSAVPGAAAHAGLSLPFVPALESDEITSTFDARLTARLLAQAPRAYRLQVDEVLIAALARALGENAASHWLIDVENHGREAIAPGLDPSATVGWFTSHAPVWLSAEADPRSALMQAKRALRRAPLRGLHFGLLAQLGDTATRAAIAALPRPQIGFNYLGRFGAEAGEGDRFALAQEKCGRFVADASPLSHALEVNALITDGVLTVSLRHDPRLMPVASRRELARRFERELAALLQHLERAEPALSAEDFPLAQLDPAALDALTLSAAQVEDIYPATPLQQGLLFHTLLDREGPAGDVRASGDAYVNQVCVTLRGQLDAERLYLAWDRVIARHPILRTQFAWAHGGDTLQVVVRRAHASWTELDAAGQLAYDSWRADFLRRDLARGIDLARAPLLRLQVIRRPDGDHDLVLTNHHALLDGWSAARLLAEVRAAYGSNHAGPEQGSEAPRFRDYVAWLAQQPSSETFWRERLAYMEEAGGLLEAFGAEPPGVREDALAARHQQMLSEASSARLREAAQAARVTLSTLVHGAWALVISRYVDRRRVVFGTTVSGRPAALPGSEKLLGLFIHSLPVTADIPEELAPAAWLRALQAELLKLQQHQHTPLHALQSWAGRAGAPLFDTLLIYENFPQLARPEADGGLSFEFASGVDRTHYPLTLTVSERGALSIDWTWQPNVLSREVVGQLAAQLEHVLLQLARGVERVAQIYLRTDDAGPLQGSFAEHRFSPLFERVRTCAQRTPEACAVQSGARSLDYRTLVAESSRLAQALRAALDGAGTELEPRVGVCVERSLELPVSLLAVVAAGGAYVPLDPSYPEERLRFMLDDAGISLVIADRTSAERHARLFAQRHVLIVGEEGGDVVRFSNAQLPSSHPEQLAYILYTSGSTGRPKGVAVRHGALDRFLAAFVEAGQPSGTPKLTERDVFLSVTSPSFDIFALELFAPLVSGGRVVIADTAQASDPHALLRLIEESSATALQATPTLWRALVHSGFVAPKPSFLAFAGGEALPEDLARALSLTGAMLFNLYGPTETTIWSSAARIESGHGVHLGDPLPHTILRIVDRGGRDVPRGGLGELCIGGDNLARGYLARQALTAERFVPDDAGGRLYRTGDVCRLSFAGVLGFVGRRDAQLKLRGHRIELAEIEAALRASPGVRDAAVVVVGEGDRQRLVGFVTGDADLAAVQVRLARVLPAAFVPAVLLPRAELPRTLNGKLERKALIQLATLPEEKSEAPATAGERALAAVWSEVLDYAPVGRHDDFFAQGGHSLSAVRLSVRVERALGHTLPLRAIFATPRLSDLARLIAESPQALRPALALPLAPRTSGHPLSRAQERLWFLWKLEPASAAYNLSGGLSLAGALDHPALEDALKQVVQRHESLRTCFVEHGASVQARVEDEARCVLVVHDAAGVTDEELTTQLEALAARPFDLARGPMVRADLVRRARHEHVLLLSIHHISCDGASVDLFLRELSSLYSARGALPALDRQYRDYASWERSEDHERSLAADLAYWRERLSVIGEPLELPADRVRRGLRDAAGGRVVRTLDTRDEAKLRALCGGAGVTRFTVLLAALDVLLARYAGTREVRVGIPVSGRRHAEAEPMIGLFVNTLVHRAEVRGRLTLGEFLRTTQANLAADLEHAGVPLARLVTELAPERDLGETPLFNVSFNFEETPREVPALAGLSARPWPLAQAALPFDLMFDVSSAEGVSEVALSFVHDRFDQETASRTLDDYLGVLGELALERLDRTRLGEIALPSLRGSAPAAALRYPFRSAYQRFVAQVEAQPEATALEFGGERFSYRALHAWSQRIGARLRALGVTPQERVAICLDRSPAVVAAILGTLSAGAVYVPLDPRYPDERLWQTLGDARVRCMIAEREARWEKIDLISPHDGPEPVAPVPTPAPYGDELAYIIYTSGSTGVPKGVAVTHENLARLFDAANDLATGRPGGQARLSFGRTDRWTLFHSPSFDFSVWEIFGPLVSGGTLVVVPYATTRDPAAFHALLARAQITVLSQTPSAFMPLMQLDLAAQAPVTSLRALIFGGERLEPSLLAPWALARGAELPAVINMYGITETTVHVTERALSAHDLRAGAALKSVIGRALPDLTLHVLDDDLNEVPVNGSGEIYVGGAGLARGYWQRAALTATRFIPSPFARGQRLYASGDRARRLADGDVEYLGRSDFQVKIRGFRIELGEIEAALREHPSVHEAAVLVGRPADGGDSLIAFFVAPDLTDAELEALRAFVAQRLPAHMVPAFFQRVAALPLTANGKLDRVALLSAPLALETALGNAEPASESEALICRVFAELLGFTKVGADAEFFRLGGHSLMAVRAAALLSAARGVDVPVSALFLHPSVRALAHYLDNAATAGEGALDAMSELLDQISADEG